MSVLFIRVSNIAFLFKISASRKSSILSLLNVLKTIRNETTDNENDTLKKNGTESDDEKLGTNAKSIKI